MQLQVITSDLTFRQAFLCWKEQLTIPGSQGVGDVHYVAPRSIADYVDCSVALGKFFNDLPLAKIHLGHIRQYQNARAVCDQSVAKWSRPAGSYRIRKEINLLIRLLTAAGLWSDNDNKNLKRVQLQKADARRALSPEEQHRFLHVASTRERFQYVYCYSVLALQTAASTDELRALRLGDIFLQDRHLIIRKGKNKHRKRTIPLVTELAQWAVAKLLERAKEMGSVALNHCLFPRRKVRGVYDPSMPMSECGLRKPWDEVRQAADLPTLRLYDLRHTAITRMAEAGVPIQVIMSYAGHIDPDMQQHYTAISDTSQRRWGQSVWETGQTATALASPGPPRAPTQPKKKSAPKDPPALPSPEKKLPPRRVEARPFNLIQFPGGGWPRS